MQVIAFQSFSITSSCLFTLFALTSTWPSTVSGAICPDEEEQDFSKRVKIGLLLPSDPLPVDPYYADSYTYNPRYPFFLQMVKPAVDIALETVKEKILPNVNITLYANDTQCISEKAEEHVISLYYDKSVTCFIGPACVFAASFAVRSTYRWNVPLLTAGALSASFRTNPNLLTQLQGDYLKHGLLISKVLGAFNWKKVALLCHNELSQHNNYKFLCEGIVTAFEELKKDNVTEIHFSALGFNSYEEKFYKEELKLSVLPEFLQRQFRGKLIMNIF